MAHGAQVRQLEQHHLEQVARMQHGTQSLQRLQGQIREAQSEHALALATCEALQRDVTQLRELLFRESPQSVEQLRFHCTDCPSVEDLRCKAAALEAALSEVERTAMEQIGATPPTSVAMSGDSVVGDSNPLHDLSVIADYASKARVCRAILGSPLSTATRSLSGENMLDSDELQSTVVQGHFCS